MNNLQKKYFISMSRHVNQFEKLLRAKSNFNSIQRVLFELKRVNDKFELTMGRPNKKEILVKAWKRIKNLYSRVARLVQLGAPGIVILNELHFFKKNISDMEQIFKGKIPMLSMRQREDYREQIAIEFSMNKELLGPIKLRRYILNESYLGYRFN